MLGVCWDSIFFQLAPGRVYGLSSSSSSTLALSLMLRNRRQRLSVMKGFHMHSLETCEQTGSKKRAFWSLSELLISVCHVRHTRWDSSRVCASVWRRISSRISYMERAVWTILELYILWRNSRKSILFACHFHDIS